MVRAMMLWEWDVDSFLIHCRFTGAGEQEIYKRLALTASSYITQEWFIRVHESVNHF